MAPRRLRRGAGCEEPIAVENKVRNLRPVVVADIQTKRRPAPGPDVRRQVESIAIKGGQLDILAGSNFECDSDDAIAVVIVEIIHKRFFPHQEAGMASFMLAHRFRQ